MISDLPPIRSRSLGRIVATDVRPLADVEREYIKWFVPCGNRSQAAEKFGIGEATLHRKIKKFGDN
jgi:DNA-binding NtrC family response regulator